MKVKRIAHRGFSSEAPENTQASFALAVEGDFYGIECDIWRALDGTYVVSHDGNLKRMCGVDKWIPQMTFSEIISYPVTRGKKRLLHPVQHLISFWHYLSILARSDTKHPVVELKMDYGVGELEEILELVRRADSPDLRKESGDSDAVTSLYDRTIFISMYQNVLLRLKNDLNFPPDRLQYVYGIPRPYKTLLVGEKVERWLIENRINLDSRYTLVTPGSVIRLHNEELQVNVWTVNTPEEMRRMELLGVDMVTTEHYYE